MNDELPKSRNVFTSRRSLEERLAHRPDVLARLHELADTLDPSVTDDCTADAAEARVSTQVRPLAQELLGQWPRETEAHPQAQVPQRHPDAIHYGKKKR